MHRVENNIDCLSSYYRGDLEYFREVVRAAAIYHDLGKLDSDNQKVFLHGGIKRLPVNHLDAGTAFLLKNTMGRSSILVFSHHAYPPHYGLPSIPAEIAKDEFCLRDDKTMSQTEQKLEEYISKHVESGFQQWKEVKDSQRMEWINFKSCSFLFSRCGSWRYGEQLSTRIPRVASISKMERTT